MANWEKQMYNKPKRKVPSFSSSLLDAIYHSTDESSVEEIHRNHKNTAQVEEEIESLRRAIRVEKWMENYSSNTQKVRHFPSNSSGSGSSTDSSFFSETESSVSKRETESSVLKRESESSVSSVSRITTHKPKTAQLQLETAAKREGRFTKTKSKAMKIYGDLKKVKEPISPGGKIANFLNSIFSPRALKKDEWISSSSMRKSRSMKDTTTCTLASRSCLSKNPSARGNKSKRSVRFCPVSIIVDDNSRPCGQKNVYFDEDVLSSSMPTVSSQFIKRNIDSFRTYQNQSDDDDESCTSSDLFELENIGRIGIGTYEEELPVYGTTSLEDIVI